jgi:hypothetical protein
MVRTSGNERLELGAWITEPIVFDEPTRELAIQLLLKTYKSLPSQSAGEFLDAVAAATGAGRRPPSGHSTWMSWDMVREMRAAGMVIGGHTVNHPVLARMPKEQQREEIFGCARRLETELGEPMRYFSYPVGGPTAFNADTRECLASAGVEFAFSYGTGYTRFADWDDFDIHRVAIEPHIEVDWFRAIVTIPQLFARPQWRNGNGMRPAVPADSF